MHSLTEVDTGGRLIAGLDPRCKLLAALVLLVMLISSKGLFFPLLLAGVSLVACLVTGVRPRLLAWRFAEPMFIAVTVLLLKLFFVGQEPLFTLSLAGVNIIGHRDGLLDGLQIAARIFGSVSVLALLCTTTPISGLLAALAWLRVPRDLVEVALFAWRYLFVLVDDARVVYAAQRNRLGYQGFRRGLSSFGCLSGTLVLRAFDGSQRLTTAMVQRGYDGRLPLSRQEPFRLAEVAGTVVVLLMAGQVWRS